MIDWFTNWVLSSLRVLTLCSNSLQMKWKLFYVSVSIFIISDRIGFLWKIIGCTRHRKEKLHKCFITQYKRHMTTPQHKNPCPGGHEMYNFGRTFLVHHYYILILPDLCLGVEEKIFKGIMYFHYMSYSTSPQHKNLCPGYHNLQFL